MVIGPGVLQVALPRVHQSPFRPLSRAPEGNRNKHNPACLILSPAVAMFRADVLWPVVMQQEISGKNRNPYDLRAVADQCELDTAQLLLEHPHQKQNEAPNPNQFGKPLVSTACRHARVSTTAALSHRRPVPWP